MLGMAAGRVRARPADALLASSLLSEDELGCLFDGLDVRKRRDEGLLGTGVRSVDEALDGGISSGRIVGIWGDGGENEVSIACFEMSDEKWVTDEKVSFAGLCWSIRCSSIPTHRLQW